MLVSFALHC